MISKIENGTAKQAPYNLEKIVFGLSCVELLADGRHFPVFSILCCMVNLNLNF
jgi:hypothetical protein